MKSNICLFLFYFTVNTLFGQLFSFEPAAKLFDLEPTHVHLDQPMIPSPSAESESGYDFSGMSGAKLVRFSRQTNGSYLKKIFPDDIFANYVIATADFNKDGNLDILTDFRLYRFDGTQHYEVALDNWQYKPQGVLDYNNDGLMDILVTLNDFITDLDELIILKNKGNWTFEKISIEKNVKRYQTYKIFDVDNNSFPDIVATVTKPDNLIAAVVFNNGTNTFQIKSIDKTFYDYNTSTLEVIDMDNDGDGDIMIGDESFGIWYFENIDNFATTNEPVYDEIQDELASLFMLFSSDFNNDGLNDVLAISQGDNYSFWLYKSISPYKFAPHKEIGKFKGGTILSYTHGNSIIKNVHILDYNSDGLKDIVFTSGFDKKQVVLINKTIISSTDDEEIKFEIYPNPTSDFINVEDDNNGNTTYEIMDNNGSIIKTVKGVSKIDLQEYPQGIYNVRRNSENRPSKNKRIVKY
ncbi:MAG: T9SS type A sorting domain-containing protein [Saprospiraceae bacterium]|nr:T9SS type A sorting domain-containing protein [Saprospiraceae bacterium]MBP6567225.1 T9SS type A sorting domain-containing protein [Saprospiraceae bacterium]